MNPIVQTPITEIEIDAARTPAGGFTAKTLAQWGVSWPPPKGWKQRLVENGFPLLAVGSTETELQRTQRLFREAMLVVVDAGHIDIFSDHAEILAYFGGKNPWAPNVPIKGPHTVIEKINGEISSHKTTLPTRGDAR